MSETHSTTDHDTIRKWTEARNGLPTRVAATGDGDDPGILRIDFPGDSGDDALEEISWEDWFRKFDEQRLAFLYQEETGGGERSHFNKLVSRDSTGG